MYAYIDDSSSTDYSSWDFTPFDWALLRDWYNDFFNSNNVDSSPAKRAPVPQTQNQPDKKCWAAGINFEFSTINPFTSGGGGSYGLNIEWTAGGGLAIYTYGTPNNTPSHGLLIGPSVTLNAATGKGAWTGLFDSTAGSFGPVTGGAFWSPLDGGDPGYFGLNAGIGKGPPGVGTTTTNYTKRAQLTHPAPNNCTE